MMDNERRADIGQQAVTTAGAATGVIWAEPIETVVTDALAYIAHFCDRVGIDPHEVFLSAIDSYGGDFEDGPRASPTGIDAREAMWTELSSGLAP